jgi:hypothetical protein
VSSPPPHNHLVHRNTIDGALASCTIMDIPITITISAVYCLEQALRPWCSFFYLFFKGGGY